MKIQLWAIGKTTTPYISTGIDNYISRIKHYVPFEFKIIGDIKKSNRTTPDQQCVVEGEAILQSLGPGDYLVLLDEHGTEFTSREFSVYLEKRMGSVSRNLIFVIGGPYGFSDAVYARADGKISLSRMTFSHEMVRLFFVEQLYRAMTIMRGEPYHHD